MPLFFWFDLSLEARAEILKIFRSYFGRNDDLINLFWDLLTFSRPCLLQHKIIDEVIGGLFNSKACFLHHLDFFFLENWIESISVLHNERPQHMPVCISTSQLGLQHSTYKNRPFFSYVLIPLVLIWSRAKSNY